MQNEKLRYVDTDSFIIHIKAKYFYEDIANYVEKLFDASNYDVNRPLPTGKNKKVTDKLGGLMTDELGGKIMTELVALRSKTYSYLMHDHNNDKEANGTKK